MELIPVYRQSAHRWLLSHPPGGRLPLLSARRAVTFPAEERHRPSDSTKLYCLVIEAHECEQLAQGCYSTARRPGLKLASTESQSDALATRLSSKEGKEAYSSLCYKHHTATGTHVPYEITQCYLPPGRGDIPAITPAN